MNLKRVRQFSAMVAGVVAVIPNAVREFGRQNRMANYFTSPMQGRPRTREQHRRMNIISRELGCEACHIDRMGLTCFKTPEHSVNPAQIHHNDNFSPQDHDHIFGLCSWHHLGEGKSVTIGSKDPRTPPRVAPHLKQREAFRREYGTQEHLERRCNARLLQWESDVIGRRS